MMCPFCEIAAGRPAPGYSRLPPRWERLHHTGVVVFEPLNPVVPGHSLIVSRLHTTHPAENPELAGHIVEWAAEYATGKGAYNLIVSAGAAASQTVDHLHVHFVPRREGDGLFLPWGNTAS